MGLLPRCLPHRQWWVAVPLPGLTSWYVHQEVQIVTYPTKGCTLDVQALRKAPIEVPNLSKEKCVLTSL
jgi:hypothetical protein